MSEPEEVILEGVHLATTFARDLWRRNAPQAQEHIIALDAVRQRLELFVGAICGVTLPIVGADPPATPTWLARIARRAPGHGVEREACAATDGERIQLPKTLDAPQGEAAALTCYRLLALEQAIRAVRGTPHALPDDGDLLVRDLFLLSEAVAVDRALAADLPGLLPDLCAARAVALAARPLLDPLTPAERSVERLLRAALAAHPAAPPGGVPLAVTSAESLAWARDVAPEVSGGGYRGLPLVALWGRVLPTPPGAKALQGSASDAEERPGRAPGGRFQMLRRRPKVREAAEDEDDARPGMWMARIDAPAESVEDPLGLQRPADRDDQYSPEELADALAELPEARLVHTPGAPREVLASEDPPYRRAYQQCGAPTAAGIVYPEWDWRADAYRARGAIVREVAPALGERTWADLALARHARLVRRVRRQFDSLRPRRVRLGRQTDGDEVDLSAYVTAFADIRAGQAVEDRLYVAARPVRRDIVIALLIDISASTDSWVAGNRRIIDVEKEALLIVCEALYTLGERYAILAFSGAGPGAVVLLTLKSFAERNGEAVLRRIAALEPDRYTRVGTAIRHVTTLLARETARHRLLLILSDGKPNDVDLYEGRYGVEDTRLAIAEARLQGIHPFCLTVDRQAPAYLQRMFGPGASAVLRRPELLSPALVDIIRRLVRS